MTQITKKDYFRLRPKIYNSILGSISYKIRSLSSNINNILFINKSIDKKTKLNIKIVFKIIS